MASAFPGARYLIFALTLYLLPPGAPLTANDRHFLEIQIEPHRHDRLGDSQGVLYSQSSEKLARSSPAKGQETSTRISSPFWRASEQRRPAVAFCL
jgi:hypothetical protein